MQIYFKRSGGYMGIPMQGEVDTSSLPAEQAEIIENMLDEAQFFDLPSDPSAQTNGPDRFTYELKVIRNNAEHTVYFSEQNAPVEINTLVRHLTTLARRHAADESESESETR
jgi:hypothetical protein